MSLQGDKVGTILSQPTTREATCQLFEGAERGGIREGMLLIVEASPDGRHLLSRVSGIVPYNDFFTEGDAWSEARRKQLPVPEEVARRYVTCSLELLTEIPGANEITVPPHPGDCVYRVSPDVARKQIFGVDECEPGIIWFGTQVGYKASPVALDVEAAPMHMAVFGVTGSGKSFDMGALIERLASIPAGQGHRVSFPLLMIDAHGDYLEYCRHLAQGASMGAVSTVTRYVFPDAFRRRRMAQTDQNVEPIGMNFDIEALPPRDIAEMVIEYYGGTGSELQVHGLERALQQLKEAGASINLLFTSSRELLERQLQQMVQENDLNRQSQGAILRAISRFREVEEKFCLFSQDSPLRSEEWVERLTREGNLAVVDFSAEGAPGVELRTKQLVMTYLAAVLFHSFTKYKAAGEDRHLIFAIEEAQNFCPDTSYPVGASLARSRLSAIATQGRKFGLGLCLISQRPSFVDRIVLSMCNTFFIHRVSPEDVTFVRTVTGGLPQGLVARLTRLGRGEMIICGQMSRVPFPLMVKVEREHRTVSHPAGTTQVVKSLARLRRMQ